MFLVATNVGTETSTTEIDQLTITWNGLDAYSVKINTKRLSILSKMYFIIVSQEILKPKATE